MAALSAASAVPLGEEDREPKGHPIPETLRYLNPQRVWIFRSGATIELTHMMDDDVTLDVERGTDGAWSVFAHVGDYMDKRRLVWTEKPAASQAGNK